METSKNSRLKLIFYFGGGCVLCALCLISSMLLTLGIVYASITINRYNEIKDQHPDAEKCGVFWAFSNEQFERGYRSLVNRGFIKDGDKLCGGPAGIIDTRSGIRGILEFYDKRDKQISQECDAQEVYFYEYNNHECCYGWEGDAPAYELIVDYFGEDVAKTIKRI